MINKPPFDGERIQISDLLEASFSGEWGSADGPVLTPVLRTANFNEDGTLDYSNPAMRCITEKKVRAKKMRRGDIILEKSGGTPHRPVGILAYYDSDGLALCSNFNQVLRFDSFKVVPRYAFYQLRWLKDKGAFAKYTRKTTGLQNLEMKRFSELVLSIPKLSIQHHVVGILDKILDDRNLLDDQLAKLDELVKSRFVEMFGDTYLNSKGMPTARLGDLIGFITSGSRGWAKYYCDEGEYFITIKNVKNCSILLRNMQCVNAPDNKEARRTKVQQGDVLISITADLGRTGVVTKEIAEHGAYINQHLACIRLNTPKLLPLYLAYYLESPGAVYQFVKKNQNGVKAGLNFNLVKSLQILLPPLALQQEFTAFVEHVDKLRFEAQKQKDELQTLYDSLAQEYFAI